MTKIATICPKRIVQDVLKILESYRSKRSFFQFSDYKKIIKEILEKNCCTSERQHEQQDLNLQLGSLVYPINNGAVIHPLERPQLDSHRTDCSSVAQARIGTAEAPDCDQQLHLQLGAFVYQLEKHGDDRQKLNTNRTEISELSGGGMTHRGSKTPGR